MMAPAHIAQGSSVTYKFATRQPVVAHGACGIAQGGNFGMRRGVVFADRRIESAANNFTIAHNDGTDRHFTQTFGRTGLRNGFTHEVFVAQTKRQDVYRFFRSHYSCEAI
jgi:hypothetical protein